MQQQNGMKTIGVLGGMGPMATANLMQAIVENTRAECDQQHPPVIIDSNTRIPDRTAFLLGNTAEDPRPELLATAGRLKNSGVACIIMPCNTAHAFYDEIVEEAGIPVLHMIEETAKWITENFPEQKRIGVLATQGTYHANVYRDSLWKFGLTQVVPDQHGQDQVTKVIYDGIKAGNYSYDFSRYEKTIVELKRKNNVEVMILGCTELSVAQKYHPIEGIFADPLQIIARSAIKFTGGRVTSSAVSTGMASGGKSLFKNKSITIPQYRDKVV
ncbi:MAG: amino acid racemase [Desulfobulbaceae bacterium]|nr:amino acid racemase [Desulfobulbaceae bacterium]